MSYHSALSALADPTRRALFEALAKQPASVAELAQHHPISRPAVSQHLKVLSEAGLVRVQPQGTRRIYQINRSGLDPLRQYIDGFWQDALGAYAKEVQRQSQN